MNVTDEEIEAGQPTTGDWPIGEPGSAERRASEVGYVKGWDAAERVSEPATTPPSVAGTMGE
jgi:hypothetical protein